MSELKSPPQIETCPVGVDDCQWLSELSKLKAENAELKQLVTTDTLTGLYNFRYFREMLAKEMEQTQRAGRPTGLIMIDLDHFKAINDEWGHEGGNQALILAASVFRQAVRLSDIVCRYGGEEFAIILPQTTLPTAVNVAERVRQWLQQSMVDFDGQQFSITASFGVGVFSRGQQVSAEAFIDSVDQYLYQAKQQGRNRVAHADFVTLETETAVSTEEKTALFSSEA
jgi:diguanylate cyclase (GGDEF)-like protein